MQKTDIIDYYGTDRTRQQHNNYFEQFTFEDFHSPKQPQFAHWEGLRQDHNTSEYFKSTQNEFGYRCERQDELEHRVITPGYSGFYHEITPERLAHDPNDAIYNYFNGWQKNISDGNVSVNTLRSQLRKERKGNYFRVRNQVSRFIFSTREGINGPVHHPELM